MTKTVNEREIVLEILMEVTENGAYSHRILRDVLTKYQYLDKRELCQGSFPEAWICKTCRRVIVHY